MRAERYFFEGPENFTRRSFLLGLGCAGTSWLLAPFAAGRVKHIATKEILLCVGSFTREDAGTLHSVRMQGGRCERISSLPLPRPLSLVRHPRQPIVYVASGVHLHAHEPRGVVEAILVDPKTGSLNRVARQPLSLSATEPRSLAISPNGERLVVAAFGGGAYNVLPVDAVGIPGPPAAILKQVGRGSASLEPKRSHPAAVLFHPREPWAVAVDSGAERLDLLHVQHGTESTTGSRVASRISCPEDSGPCGLALHSDGSLLVAIHRLRPALSTWQIGSSGQLSAVTETPFDRTPTAVAFHPYDDVLYLASRVSSQLSRLEMWRVQVPTGVLSREAELSIRCGGIAAIEEVSSRLCLAAETGLIAVDLETATAVPTGSHTAADIAGACCLTVLIES